MMPNEMGAAGASASASKKDAMKTSNEVFDDRVTIERLKGDGSFLVSASMRKEPIKKGGRGGDSMAYDGCADRKMSAATKDEALSKASALFDGETANDNESPAAEPIADSEAPTGPAAPAGRPY